MASGNNSLRVEISDYGVAPAGLNPRDSYTGLFVELRYDGTTDKEVTVYQYPTDRQTISPQLKKQRDKLQKASIVNNQLTKGKKLSFGEQIVVVASDAGISPSALETQLMSHFCKHLKFCEQIGE